MPGPQKLERLQSERRQVKFVPGVQNRLPHALAVFAAHQKVERRECRPGRRAGRCRERAPRWPARSRGLRSAVDIQRRQLAQNVAAARAGQQELRVDRSHVGDVDGRRQQQIRRRRERCAAARAQPAPRPDRRSPDNARGPRHHARASFSCRRRLHSVALEIELHHPAHVAQANAIRELLGFLLRRT